jgi:hypothetical protein
VNTDQLDEEGEGSGCSGRICGSGGVITFSPPTLAKTAQGYGTPQFGNASTIKGYGKAGHASCPRLHRKQIP